jgi:outer membrane protein TolC
MVEHAFARRPDLKAQGETMVGDDMSIQLADNAMRPDLALTFQYGSLGQGGTYFPGTGFAPIPGGFWDAFTQMFGFGYPTYGFGVRLRLPIKDRAAAANLSDAVVNKKLDTLRQKSIMQGVRLQVLQAISQVESSKASVDLAKVARDLAQKRVDAEQKRYELGTTTIFFVLAAQTDLTTAESTLVRESINYKRNLLQLSARTGDLLDERGIKIQ